MIYRDTGVRYHVCVLCTLFANSIVLVGESPEEVNGRLEEWKAALEDKELRISMSKTEYIKYMILEKGNMERIGKGK